LVFTRVFACHILEVLEPYLNDGGGGGGGGGSSSSSSSSSSTVSCFFHVLVKELRTIA
jgi:hypothetical protein